MTTGCALSAAPYVVEPGWVANTSRSSAAGLTVIELELVLPRPELKLMVMFVATLCDRLVNVTTPSAVVAILVVPCKVPLPARRAAVTTVPAEMPLAALRRLPN